METKMVLVNEYGDVVCELQKTGLCSYGVKDEDLYLFTDLLWEGDEYRVKAIEVEE